MAEIDDTLPNETITDEAFVEQEVTVPNEEMEESSEGVEVTMDDEGGAQIDFDPKAEGLESQDHFSNLAEIMEDQYLGELGSTLFDQYTEYKESRADWENTYREGLELLGFKYERRTEPFRGASGVNHPVLAEAVTQFQAQAYKELLPADGPVRAQILGDISNEKQDQANRVKDFMNYQIMDQMPEYEPEFDQMLFYLPLSGSTFKKIYYDDLLGRAVSKFVPADDLIVPYSANSLEDAEAIVHVIRMSENEIRKQQVSGFYKDVEVGNPPVTSNELKDTELKLEGITKNSNQDQFNLLEMHVDLDLEGYEDEDNDGEKTGIALPYVVTIEKSSNTILAIRRNWSQDDSTRQKRQHFVHYGYVPGFGFYHFGLIHLIGAFAKSGTMILRQLVDAGTLSNLPGGFKSRGLRIKGDDTPISPAEFRDVDVPSGSIRDNILPLPYKEPSQVLNQLMNQIVEEGRRFASAADLKVSDMSANAPVGTTLAILERTLKVMSAVQSRIHYSMRQEFKLIKNIIRDYTDDEYGYTPEKGSRKAKQSDYDKVEVIPVSDPNAATMAQKVVQYQAVMQLAQQNPDIYDMVELNRQMLDVLGIKNADKLIPQIDNMVPKNPVSENMDIINSKPVKAFIYQDSEAHIKTHMSFIKDPIVGEMIGQSPNATKIYSAMEAHIAEHIAFVYRQKIEEELGAPLPPPEEALPEDIEVELSRLVAKAGEQLLQKNTTEAQQQQQQQQQQDPLIQMQQQELQIKQMEAQAKSKKMNDDFAIDQARLELDKMKMESQERIAGAKMGADAVNQQKELDAKEFMEGTKLGAEAVMRKQERDKTQT